MGQQRDWQIFHGTGKAHEQIDQLPAPPPWRTFYHPGESVSDTPASKEIARVPQGEGDPHFFLDPQNADDQKTIELINAALYLRRPLLVTGKPGTGKSTLARAVAFELSLGKVLEWPITTRSTLKEGLYDYDVIARAHADKSSHIGDFIKLGPLGTALLPSRRPRVLLIDEIDKSDIDLPNDLLHVFEKGFYEIPELLRLANMPENRTVQVRPHDSQGKDDAVGIQQGRVQCKAFPFVIMTSNGERDFPQAFLRRCIRLDLKEPDQIKLGRIVDAHFGGHKPEAGKLTELIEAFLQRRGQNQELATDQLLNAVYLTTHFALGDKDELLHAILRELR